MIDAFCKWATEADAKSDAVMLANQFGILLNRWRTDHVLPDVQAWRPSQDTVTGTPPIVVHNYLAGWFAIVATNSPVQALMSLAATQFVLNRDGPPYVILNNIGAIISDVAVAPIFAGSHYPIGGLSS